MQFHKARVADIVTTFQRDDLFVMDVEQQIHTVLKLMGSANYHKLNSYVPIIAKIWYYCVTSVSNIQTLGEEYSGTIRMDKNQKIPSRTLEVIWIILHVGGEPLMDRFLTYSRKKISASPILQTEAKSLLLRGIQIIKEEKATFKKIHNALFYLNGKYYKLSNRITGIQYVLLREWMEDDSFTGSFFVLGHLSMFYVLLNFVLKFYSSESNYTPLDNIEDITISEKVCVLCGENIQSASCTPCGHIFCWTCIYECLQYQKNCPICREVVHINRIVVLQNFL